MAVGKDLLDRFAHTQKPLGDFSVWHREIVTGYVACR